METICLQGPEQNQDHFKDQDYNHSLVLVLDTRLIYDPFTNPFRASLKFSHRSSLL